MLPAVLLSLQLLLAPAGVAAVAAGSTRWLDTGAASPDAPVRLTLALQQRGLAELERSCSLGRLPNPLGERAVQRGPVVLPPLPFFDLGLASGHS